MHNMHNLDKDNLSLKTRVQQATQITINDCYQCGKCSAGCPVCIEMDIKPNQILRLLQLDRPEDEQKILKSLGIWMCLGCETCFSRCPKDVELPQIMDFLRTESIRLGLVHKDAKKIIAFHKSFLDNLKRNGRLKELELTLEYKINTFDLISDIEKAPSMYIKGKLNLFPHKIKGAKKITKIFNKINNGGKDNK